jgi:KDO2-lipid IV(A) lauroyltransferase
MSPAERGELLRGHFESLGIGFFEAALAWWAPSEKLTPLLRIEGLEHLQAVLRQGQGAYLLGGHFTTLELSGRILRLFGVPFSITYREHPNPLLDHAGYVLRTRIYGEVLHRFDTRGVVRTLRSGGVVWLAADQDMGVKRSVFAPFFGVSAATVSAPARLARMGASQVLTAYCLRLPGADGYLFSIGAPLSDFPSGDLVADAGRVNRALEGMVLRVPEQYLWIHRRFKTRPQGEPGVYAPKPRRRRRAHRRERAARRQYGVAAGQTAPEQVTGLRDSAAHGPSWPVPRPDSGMRPRALRPRRSAPRS